MEIKNLETILKNEPSFRLKQARRAVYVDLIDDWRQAFNLSLDWREKLNQACPLVIKSEIFKSRDQNSVKALIYLADGLKIETVLLRHARGRNTVCLSSQVGCPLGCLFCATGQMGFKRNLTAGEIVEQAVFWARWLKYNPPSPLANSASRLYQGRKYNPLAPLWKGGVGARVNNIVFMGMGEPFLNYENVMAAIKVLNVAAGLNIGARHISLSTVGVEGGLVKLAKENLQLNLAWSLHAPNDELRAKIIPYNNANSIKNLINDVNYYLAQTKRRLMIEYLMLDGFNDSREQALELAALLKRIKPPLFFVNLIAYNPTADFKPSPARKIFEFKKILREQKIDVTERFRFGQDIKAACGQLAGEG